jgi:L-ascorbate metabolism protein UlaG (beta-lactamase superfamily)
MWNLLRLPIDLLVGIYATRRSLAGGPGHRGPVSDHFNGETFFNPGGAPAGKPFKDFWRWQRNRKPAPWPLRVENRFSPDLPREVRQGELVLTFVNHITFLMQFRGLNVLTDPVYSERVSPVQWAGPKRVRDPGLAFEALPPIDLVLLSHNHYDHLDLRTLKRLDAAHAPQIVTTLGNRAFLEEFGLRRVQELDWWESTTISDVKITLAPAQHWSGRGARGRNRSLWGGFVTEFDGRCALFAGDTGYGPHFKEIHGRFGPMDLALLPIGAYEPRWFMQAQHMDPDEAVRAHLDLKSRCSVGTHFGCFQLTDEPFEAPVRELEAARRRHGVTATEFRVLDVGETARVVPSLALEGPVSAATIPPVHSLAAYGRDR